MIAEIMNTFSLREKAEKDAKKALCIHKRLNSGTFSKIGGMLLKRKLNKLCLLYGCFIPVKASIGDGLQTPHGLFGIFISQNAVIGKNCCIFHQVTIGSNTLSDSKGQGAPRIGDNVFIGAGAKIIGKCVIGNNVRIGANAVVTKDVPNNSTIVGVEGRIITHEKQLDNSFIPI